MSFNIGNDEKQVGYIASRMKNSAFSLGELRAEGTKIYGEEIENLEGWETAIQNLLQQNIFVKVESLYSLTPEGIEFVDGLAGDSFGEGLVVMEKSRVYGLYCERLFGKNLSQYSMIQMPQLEKLLEVLAPNAESQVLDLGCGVGTITEYITDVTQARIIGVDFARAAILRAQERTQAKADRLTFQVGNMNSLNLPAASFDTVIAIDTLYFARNLNDTIRQLKIVTKTTGQMGLFFSQVIPPEGSLDLLQADNTRLAQALNANHLSYSTYDFSTAEHAFWGKAIEVCEELKAEFEAEGMGDICRERVREASNQLTAIEAGRVSRYLYHVHNS